MAINKDMSAVQQATRQAAMTDGVTPDAAPRFGPVIAQTWFDKYVEGGNTERATAFGTLLRGSDAGACARDLGYRVERRLIEQVNEGARLVHGLDAVIEEPIPESNPPTIADHWRMGLGSMIHSFMEEYLPIAFPGAQCEVKIKAADLDLSMHADAVIEMEDGKKILLELKSINGFGFKQAVGMARRGDTPQGPRSNAVLQGAIAALEEDCDELVIVYLSMELIGKAIAASRNLSDIDTFVAEWTFSRAEFEPVARQEMRRMQAVLDVVEAGALAPRAIPDKEIPKGARITDPSKGTWVLEVDGKLINTGSTWMCQYCRERDRCIGDGA